MDVLHNNKRLRSLLALISAVAFVVLLFTLGTEYTFAQEEDTSNGTLIGNLVGKAILEIGAFFIWWGGMLLELSVTTFVVEMGSRLGDGSTMGGAITNAWAVVRDAANLAFIFGFIYIGIKTIIDYEDAQTRRTLASIIIGALLINFSLFFTKIVIDAGNILAVNIYNLMTFTNTTGGNPVGIASGFAQLLGITGFYNVTGYSIPLAALATNMSIWYYLAATVLLLVAAFVFAAGGFLLIIRFVALIFIMIFSPVLFAATVFPQTADHAKKLWSMLINYSFYPAIFFFVIYVSFQILQSGQAAVVGGNTATMFEALQGSKIGGGGYTNYPSILYYIITLVFMVAALLIAHKLSIYGGSQAVKIGVNMRRGVQGYVGRKTVGGASHLAQKGVDRFDAGNSWVARGMRTVGLDRALHNVTEKGRAAKFGSSASYADVEKEKREAKVRRGRIAESQKLKKRVREGAEAVQGLQGDQTRIEMERAISGASTTLLEELSQKERVAAAHLMTNSQIENLEKSDKLDESQMAEIKQARRRAMEGIYQTDREGLTKASVDHLTAMGSEYLWKQENAVRLDSSQMDKLKDKLTKTEHDKIVQARNDALTAVAQGTPVDGLDVNYILNKKPGELAKLPASVLEPVAPQIPVNALAKVVQDGTLSKTDQAKLLQKIEQDIQSPPSNLSQAQLDQLAAVDDWLRNNPLGRQFGK